MLYYAIRYYAIRKPEGLSRARINGMQEEKVKHFYEVLQKVIHDNNLQGRPEYIYIKSG